MTRIHALVWALGLVTCPGLAVQQADAQRQMVMVVVGAPGTAEYAEQFTEWAGLWEKTCQKGGAAYRVVGLDESETACDREILERGLTDDATDQAFSALWIVLIGHGTYDGRTAKFNLRGPDISAKDLAQWLEPIGAGPTGPAKWAQLIRLGPMGSAACILHRGQAMNPEQ